MELNLDRLNEISTAPAEGQPAEDRPTELDGALEVYKAYQSNIRKSEQIQTEILKGVGAGEDIYRLFLKAVEAISLMTSNTLFKSQIERDIGTIYGRGLKAPSPLNIELKDAEERLKRLREAEARETDPDSRQRIKRAIEAHESQAEGLKTLLQ